MILFQWPFIATDSVEAASPLETLGWAAGFVASHEQGFTGRSSIIFYTRRWLLASLQDG
jgi:hypothetical protein